MHRKAVQRTLTHEENNVTEIIRRVLLEMSEREGGKFLYILTDSNIRIDAQGNGSL
jgi:hypothetical protein